MTFRAEPSVDCDGNAAGHDRDSGRHHLPVRRSGDEPQVARATRVTPGSECDAASIIPHEIVERVVAEDRDGSAPLAMEVASRVDERQPRAVHFLTNLPGLG